MHNYYYKKGHEMPPEFIVNKKQLQEDWYFKSDLQPGPIRMLLLIFERGMQAMRKHYTLLDFIDAMATNEKKRHFEPIEKDKGAIRLNEINGGAIEHRVVGVYDVNGEEWHLGCSEPSEFVALFRKRHARFKVLSRRYKRRWKMPYTFE